jgi:hypothetical protein
VGEASSHRLYPSPKRFNIKMDEKKFKEALAEVAKTDKRATAELVVEYIEPKHITQDIVGMFLNTRALNPGDALVKKVRRGIEVRQLVPGQDTLASQITVKESVHLNLDTAYAEVMHNEWEIESGEIGTLDEIRREMTAKLSDFYVVKVMNAFYVLATINDSTNFWYVSSLTRSTLEDALDDIADVAGSVKAVVGRRPTLAPITKFAGYRVGVGSAETGSPVPVPSALEEIRRTGWFGVYYGANFIALEQVYDNQYDRNGLIKDNLIVVVGDNCGEFITYGDVRNDQWTDMNTLPPTWHLRIYQQFGLIFDRMENVGIIRTDA